MILCIMSLSHKNYFIKQNVLPEKQKCCVIKDYQVFSGCTNCQNAALHTHTYSSKKTYLFVSVLKAFSTTAGGE